jgi:hypothetical protein
MEILFPQYRVSRNDAPSIKEGIRDLKRSRESTIELQSPVWGKLVLTKDIAIAVLQQKLAIASK